MTTLKEQMTSDISVFLNEEEFAQTVTYNGTEITAMVNVEVIDRIDNDGIVVELTVNTTDVAKPSYRDTVVISSGLLAGTWKVYRDATRQMLIRGDDNVWVVPIITDERPFMRYEGPML